MPFTFCSKTDPMRPFKRAVVLALLSLSCVLSVAPAVAQVAQPQQQDEFVPMSEVPPEDQLPAAPLLIAAYAFVWIAVLLYVVSVARRLGTVQGELQRLERNLNEARRR